MTGGGEGGLDVCPPTWRGVLGALPEFFKKECNLVQSGAFGD